MCGIVGVISKDTLKASSIKDMNDVIAHRGPDGEGFFFYGDVISDVDISKVESLAGKNINLAFYMRMLLPAIINVDKFYKSQPLSNVKVNVPTLYVGCPGQVQQYPYIF